MLWLNHNGHDPIGYIKETVDDIWGLSWDMYYGTMASEGKTWEIYSFVCKEP